MHTLTTLYRIVKSLFLQLLLMIALINTVFAQDLPELSASAELLITQKQEKMLGQQIMLNIQKRTAFSDDILLNEYVRSLANYIGNFSSTKDLLLSIAIDPSINAFAVPGGYITLNTGLILNTQREDELAAVIAHEIGHHTQRHIIRAIERQKQLSIPATIAMLGGILVGGQVGTAAILSTQAALGADQLAYSRTFEAEADANGMKTLTAAGYDPIAMPDFFAQLEKKSRLLGGNLPGFLRTHPISSDRIAESLARADRIKQTDKPKQPLKSDLDYAHAKTRIMALYGSPIKLTIGQLKQGLDANNINTKLSHQYGLSLAYIRNGDFHNAKEQVNELIMAEPNKLIYKILHAKLQLSQGNINQAVKQLNALYLIDKNNLSVTHEYAQALIQNTDYSQATSVLRKTQRRAPEHFWINKLLARAYGDNQQTLNALFVKAQLYLNTGQFTRALKLIKLGEKQQHPDDSGYLSARIKDLLKQANFAKKQLNDFKI